MGKSPIRIQPIAHRLTRYRLETGFSMLEAVVVVGVLLALAVGGFFAYGPITENAKRAKVKSIASEVHTGVLVANIDGDPNTKPQDVIDTYNASTNKIKVEILEPEAGIPSMSVTAPASSAEADFCVQAINVENPHITAREGACSNVADGYLADTDGDGDPNGSDPDIDGDGIPNDTDTNPEGDDTPPVVAFALIPRGDIDRDGVPNSTDTDIDGDGVLNTTDTTPNGDESILEDITSAGKGDGKTAVTVGTVSNDGSARYVEPEIDFGHSHTPISSHLLNPGQAEVTGWSFNPATPRDVYVTVWSDGEKRGTGGNHIVALHADVTCVYTTIPTMVKKNVFLVGAMLGEPYSINNPGPNSTNALIRCGSGYTVKDVVVRAQTQTEWEQYSIGSPSWVWTRDLVESWKNPAFTG